MPIRALDEPAHVLVTGASRGIGLAMVDHLLQRADVARVLAVARAASASSTLSALAAQYPERLSRIDADLTSTDDLERLAQVVESTSPRLHLLLNCAGVLHDAELRPEKSLAQLSLASLQRSFALNAFAPILLVQALLPRLRHGRAAVVASLSARVGSIGDNRLGGWYAYRAAKAAQNQLLRTLSIELRRLNPQACCLLLHPGTVDTALSLPFNAQVAADRLFTPAHSAACLLAIVAQAGPADSGRFIAWDGQDIPW